MTLSCPAGRNEGEQIYRARDIPGPCLSTKLKDLYPCYMRPQLDTYLLRLRLDVNYLVLMQCCSCHLGWSRGDYW